MNRFLLVLSICFLALTVHGFSQKSDKKMSANGTPDKALMQKIWDG